MPRSSGIRAANPRVSSPVLPRIIGRTSTGMCVGQKGGTSHFMSSTGRKRLPPRIGSPLRPLDQSLCWAAAAGRLRRSSEPQEKRGRVGGVSGPRR